MLPEAQAVSPGRAGAAGCLPAAGQVARLRRGELEAPGDQETTPAVSGAAPARSGHRIAIPARAAPGGKATAPNPVHTERYPKPTGAADRPGWAPPTRPTASR